MTHRRKGKILKKHTRSLSLLFNIHISMAENILKMMPVKQKNLAFSYEIPRTPVVKSPTHCSLLFLYKTAQTY